MRVKTILNELPIGLLLGLALFILVIATPSPFEGLPSTAWKALGIALLMAVWWTSEAVPIPVTSLLPLILAPLLSVSDITTVASAYGHPLIFLFLGGFMLSLAMEKCYLHRRIALRTLMVAGSKPSRQIAGIMAITAFLSMWMSNTATAVMMLPIGLSIIELMRSQQSATLGDTHTTNIQQKNFATALLLSIAYSASIGGVATLIGTPPNALLAAYLSETYDIHIGFAHWMILGLPVSLIMLCICWVWLTKFGFSLPKKETKGLKALLEKQLGSLGKMDRDEKLVAAVFVFTALAWMMRPIFVKLTHIPITDTGIVIISATLLFALPSQSSVTSAEPPSSESTENKKDTLLNWEDTKRLPWGVLLLFGGGLALAGMISSTGLAEYIATQVSNNAYLPSYALIFLVTVIIVFLTEVTSNTATTAGFLPLLGPISLSISDNPLMLTIPAALAASCAFMMPVATPPNSIVFASGEVRIRQMMKTGFALNIFSTTLIGLSCILMVESIF